MQELTINSNQIPRSYVDPSTYPDLIGDEYNGGTMDLVNPLSGLRQVGIKRVTWPKTWHTIDWWNDTITMQKDQDQSVQTAILPHGNYSAVELAAILQTEINTQIEAGQPWWTITYDEERKRFSFQKDVLSFNKDTIVYFSYGSQVNYIMYLLGFGPQNFQFEDTDVQTYMPYIADLSNGISNLYLTFDELNSQDFINLNVRSQPNTICATLPIPPGFDGQHVSWEPDNLMFIEFDIPFMLRKLTPTFYVMIGLDLIPVKFEGAPFEIVIYYQTKTSRKESQNRSGRL